MRLSNLIARGVAAAISVALIACTDPAPEPDPEAAAEIGPSETLPPLPPPSVDNPRFVGLWATTQQGCEAPAWRFSADGVSTLGEVSCDFSTLTQTAVGYDVAATCHAEGETTTHNMQFSFAESARAMMIAGGPWQPSASLVYCDALPQE